MHWSLRRFGSAHLGLEWSEYLLVEVDQDGFDDLVRDVRVRLEGCGEFIRVLGADQEQVHFAFKDSRLVDMQAVFLSELKRDTLDISFREVLLECRRKRGDDLRQAVLERVIQFVRFHRWLVFFFLALWFFFRFSIRLLSLRLLFSETLDRLLKILIFF